MGCSVMNNRTRLQAIKQQHGWSARQLRDRLAALTGDDISIHTVRSWLADPERDWSRPCPGWPVALLDIKPP